jgi:hypothetical protein
LPVLRNDRVVGLITRANLFDALASVVRMLVTTLRKQCPAHQDFKEDTGWRRLSWLIRMGFLLFSRTPPHTVYVDR